jgi:DNA-directed RNA polymerase subunit K
MSVAGDEEFFDQDFGEDEYADDDDVGADEPDEPVEGEVEGEAEEGDGTGQADDEDAGEPEADESDGEPDEELIKGLASILETESDVSDIQKIVDHRRKLADMPSGLPNRLSKYELAAIIGFRAQQLAEGAPPYVKVLAGMDPISIAIAEFDHNLIPLMIERPIPSNKIGRFKYETYKLDELLNVLPTQ